MKLNCSRTLKQHRVSIALNNWSLYLVLYYMYIVIDTVYMLYIIYRNITVVN